MFNSSKAQQSVDLIDEEGCRKSYPLAQSVPNLHRCVIFEGSIEMGQGTSKPEPYSTSTTVGRTGMCPSCDITASDSDENSSKSMGKRIIDDYDITSVFMIAWGLLGVLLLIAAFIAWRRRSRAESIVESEVLHTTASSMWEDLESGSNGKTTLNIEEAPPVYDYD
ncbi:hypothetical protein DFS33DRAFT_1455325 [Desarmillaria ectypa]|nr:hypothetical protein DFS33DRAFT_1455325 [Desarmillaria ectypa]